MLYYQKKFSFNEEYNNKDLLNKKMKILKTHINDVLLSTSHEGHCCSINTNPFWIMQENGQIVYKKMAIVILSQWQDFFIDHQ